MLSRSSDSVNKLLLRAYSVPGTILSTENKTCLSSPRIHQISIWVSSAPINFGRLNIEKTINKRKSCPKNEARDGWWWVPAWVQLWAGNRDALALLTSTHFSCQLTGLSIPLDSGPPESPVCAWSSGLSTYNSMWPWEKICKTQSFCNFLGLAQADKTCSIFSIRIGRVTGFKMTMVSSRIVKKDINKKVRIHQSFVKINKEIYGEERIKRPMKFENRTIIIL